MAKDKPSNPSEFQPGEAARSVVSLSQVLLAPLDSLFKAQIHAARSFLSMVLQLGTPHVPLDEKGDPIQASGADNKLYYMEFTVDSKDADRNAQKGKIRIPALAMLPLHPLSIEEASFQVDFNITHLERHRQIQRSEESAIRQEKGFDEKKRPWYLVSDPISVRGVLAPSASAEILKENSEQSTVKINVKVTRQAMPVALDKLLSQLTQLSTFDTANPGPEAGKQEPDS
jgi:hypothetical protein